MANKNVGIRLHLGGEANVQIDTSLPLIPEYTSPPPVTCPHKSEESDSAPGKNGGHERRTPLSAPWIPIIGATTKQISSFQRIHAGQ